jgi:predicted CopG family antitoxin
MEMMERFYGRNEELERKFDKEENKMQQKKPGCTEKVGDAQTMEACRDAYQELVKEVRAEGEDFGNMMRLYSDMKKHGNSLLDLSGTYQEPEKILKVFREFGVKEFTFSSTWSSAIQVAWAIYPAGLQLKGMTEIYGSGQEIHEQRIRKSPRLPLQPLRNGDSKNQGACGLLFYCSKKKGGSPCGNSKSTSPPNSRPKRPPTTRNWRIMP